MTMKRLLSAIVFFSVVLTALVAGGGGGGSAANRQRNGIIMTYSWTSLSGGACVLPGAGQPGAGLAFTRSGSGYSVQTGTSTVDTSVTSTDQPRCGRRLDANNIGLAFEEARTQSFPQPRNPSSASLAVGSGDTYTSGQSDPTGGTAAYRVVVTSSGYSKYADLGVGSGTYVASMWVRKGSGSGVYQLGNYGTLLSGSAASGTAASTWARVITPAHTFSANNRYGIPNDGEDLSGLNDGGGTTAGARDAIIDLIQWEVGAFATEVITSAATRNGEHLEYTSAPAVISNGRLMIRFTVRPKAAPANYSAAFRLWTRGSDYAEFATTGVLTVSIGGSTNTTVAWTWAQYDLLEGFVAAGGNAASVISYRVNGGTAVHPTVTGSALGSVSTAGVLELFCSGTSSQFTSWIYEVEFWKGQTKPTWAANELPEPHLAMAA